VYRAVPSIDTSKCRGCGKCAESCPMKLIKVIDGKAGMSVKNCISCFCCQEMCPFDAVRVRNVLRMPKI
jgi:ferredoxin